MPGACEFVLIQITALADTPRVPHSERSRPGREGHMSFETYADKTGHQLGLIRGVRHASWESSAPGELRFLVVLDEMDFDVREMVIHHVDEFARDYVEEVGVELCIMDVSSADHELAARA